MTAYIAVELIGLWAVLVGVLEGCFRLALHGRHVKHRSALIIGAIASIVIGLGMMKWFFAGAVLVSAVVGVAAAARGVSLIVGGIYPGQQA